MNNKNTNIKIASLIEDVFTNCDIKERDKYIVKKYHHLDGESIKMKELGEEFGITKEAVRIILEKNKLKVESSAGSVAHFFDDLCKETIKQTPIGFERLKEAMLQKGFDLEGLNEKSFVSCISMFSRKNKDSLCIQPVGSGFIICDSNKRGLVLEIEKQSRNESSKNGYVNTTELSKKLGKSKISVKTQSIIDILNCIDGAAWISKRNVTFIDSRNKVLTRVKKIAAFRKEVNVKRACDAINQSISHRDRSFKDLEPSVLIKIIKLCIDCKVSSTDIIFNDKPAVSFSEIESDICSLLQSSGELELMDIEDKISNKYTKAAIYQACSLSPLIVKNKKTYSIV